MKKTPCFPTLMLCLTAIVCPGLAHAQFFKNVLNSVKQTVQSKSNDKASTVTGQAFDKATTVPSSKTGGTAAANPNDTSSADLTMKALGILTGREGVSAADSAAAIKSFMAASGGSGYFFQYETTATSKKGTTKDTMLIYMSGAGYARSEMRINMPGMVSGKIINIGHAAQRQYTVMLDPDDKTYSLNVIDTALINSGSGETYQVTKIGNETVQGFSCIHSKVISTIGSGAFKSVSTMDIWTSATVPGYALFKKMGSIENVKPKMMVALDNAGAGGFFVKMVAGDKDYSMTMTLNRAEEKSFPASLFEIPAGYTQSHETMMGKMMSGAKKK